MAEGSQTTSEEGFNLLLPEGISPEAAKLLARKLVAALEANPTTGAALARASRRAGGTTPSSGNLILSGEEPAPEPEGVPVLNEFIGILTVPMGPGASPDDVKRAIREVPGAGDVRVDTVKSFGIPPGESPH